jgi:phosphate uptake regulator
MNRIQIYIEEKLLEQRKVMSLGRSSLVISLPKHWVNLNKVKQGDVVSLEIQRDRSLVVFPGLTRKKEQRKITLYIDPNESEDSVARSIIACYLNGYSNIRLTSRKIFSIPQQKAIRHIAGILYMRLMESDARNMRITTLIDESRASVVSSVHRMHLVANSMCRDACNSLREQNAALARAVYSLDDDVDHFCFFLLRLFRSSAIDPALANQLGLDPIDCLDYQTLVYRIEHVADNAANIAIHLMMLDEEKKRIPDSLLKLMFAFGNDAVDSYDKAVNSFFSKDIASCNEIMERRGEIEKSDRQIASQSFLTPQMNAMTICSVCSIRESIKRIAEWAEAIAENTILRSYEENP